MMKKFVVVMTLLALALSLCACSNNHVAAAAASVVDEIKESEKRNVTILYEGDFTVIRTEWSYGGGSHGSSHYCAILERDNERVLVGITKAEFACWDEGDTVTGTLLEQGGIERLNIDGTQAYLIWRENAPQ